MRDVGRQIYLVKIFVRHQVSPFECQRILRVTFGNYALNKDQVLELYEQLKTQPVKTHKNNREPGPKVRVSKFVSFFDFFFG